VVGKGPSAARLNSVDFNRYNVLTLNHACIAVHRCLARIDLAHFVDIEAFEDCGRQLATLMTPTCLPWFPHRKNKAQLATLKLLADLACEVCLEHPLHWLYSHRLLHSYNATTAPRGSHSNHKLVQVRLRAFGSVGAFNLLAAAGIRQIASIGVDGGTGYAPQFDPSTHLKNGQPSFDAQLPEIERTVKANDITWTRL
jgi:hypothetical protein